MKKQKVNLGNLTRFINFSNNALSSTALSNIKGGSGIDFVVVWDTPDDTENTSNDSGTE